MDSTDNDGSSKDFFPALVKSVRRLCQKHFSFKHSVEVVGLLCLNVDNEEKENYSIKELIQRPIGLRVEALSSKVNNSSNNKDSRQPLGVANVNVNESEGSLDAVGDEHYERESSSRQKLSADVNDGNGETLEYISEDDDESYDADANETDMWTDNISMSETVSASQEHDSSCDQQTTSNQSIVNLENMEVPVVDQQNIFSGGAKCATKKMNKEEFSFVQMTPHLLFSEFSTLYPSISMRTFYRWKKEIADGMDFIHQNNTVSFSEFQKVYPEVSEEVFVLWKKLIGEQFHNATSIKKLHTAGVNMDVEQLKRSNSVENVPDYEDYDDAWTIQNIDSEEKISIVLKNKTNMVMAANLGENCDIENNVKPAKESNPHDVNNCEPAQSHIVETNKKESPSMFGNECAATSNEIQHCVSNMEEMEGDGDEPTTAAPEPISSIKMEFTDSDEEEQKHIQDQLDSPKRKLEIEMDSTVPRSLSGDGVNSSASDYSSVDLMTNSARKKRKFTSVDGIQHRREVYQKEEYELLEAMPFADYAEFSRHCPSVMKRTYFRWKRRIKEEYMYLEQNTDLSFEEFCQVFPQAKQNIFAHWKALIKQGYNFSSIHYTSDSSNHISSGNTEAADVADDGVKQSSYNFLQKNYQMEFGDFSKRFPTVTQQTFTVWKKKIQHEVQFLMSNPYYDMDYNVYSQCFPGVSKEVFGAWKVNMQQQLGSPQSGGSLYPGASYWSPFLGQAARFGTVPWSDVKPSLWMNNPLLTHMWGTAMNLSALTRNEDVAKQQMSRLGSLTTDETKSVRHTKPSPTAGHHSPSDSVSSKQQNPFTPTEADYASPRSRKQNKAEFYHFLQHPEMDFHDMSVAFPNLSLRTFYRWKREIKNAMCVLEESHSTPFSEFHIYFPDIPVDIFNKWKEKISAADGTASSEYKDSWCKSGVDMNSPRSEASTIKTSARDGLVENSETKPKRTEFHFLEANPFISFSQFSLHFPQISMRTFYTWCKEIQNKINYIRKNLSITLEEFQHHFPDISSDLFQIWRDFALSEKFSAPELQPDSLQMNLDSSSAENHLPAGLTEANLSPTDLRIKHENSDEFNDDYPQKQSLLGSGMHPRFVNKTSRPEYVFLQNNPTVDFREFFFRFPEVSGTTFYRWRREIKEIMDYIQLKPNTTYSEVMSYFPEISEDIFAHWKSIIQSGAGDPNLCVDNNDPMGSLQAMVDNRTHDDNTQEAFGLVMENPDIDKDEFLQRYPSLSQKLYYKWKKKVKELLLMLHGNPEMDFSVFSSCSSDVPEDVFIKWKDNLALYLDKAVSSGEVHSDVMDSKTTNSSEEWLSPKSRKVNQAEFLFFLMNPFMDYQEFSNNFPQISLRTFYRWRRETRDGLEYLEEYPDVSYKAFCQMFPIVYEDVFHKWKMLISVRNKVKNKACHQKSASSERQDTLAKDFETTSDQCYLSDKTVANGGDQFLHLNSLTSSTAKSKSPTSVDGLTDASDSPQDMIAVKSGDGSSSPHDHQKPDSSGSFIGFLSAAVENICKSAGLPPLDQSDSSSDGHNNRLMRQSPSVSIPRNLGGVVFPGLIPPPDRPASNSSSNLELEQHASGTEDNQPYGLGGIAFPGMMPAMSYSVASPNSVTSASGLQSVNSSASGHPIQRMAKTQVAESGFGGLGTDFSLLVPTSSGRWTCDRQVIKSESLASSPTGELMNLGTSRGSSPLFGLERTSARSISNAVTTESPVSGLKSIPSASGKNGLHDDYFFSPRLRKQNREEYMYLQQNPSMDFQEFYKVYPTISLRTFYRWKREFREDGQIGSFQQKENTNTLNTGGIQHGQILDLSAKPENMYNHSIDSEIV